MTVLLNETPLDGLDVLHGEMRLAEIEQGNITWIAPFLGEEIACGHALQAACSLHFPGPGEALESDAGRILWAGRAQALLIGPAAPATLASHAACVDQSDGWATLHLTGPQAGEVLCRLTPLDLRVHALKQGKTARSLLGHMNAQFTATAGGIEIMVMRSMARTAAHEIETAMRAFAARAAT